LARELRIALSLLGAVTALACASTGATPGASSRAAEAPTSDRILVTLTAGNERLWRGVAGELAQLDGVRVVAAWFVQSLGEECLILEAPMGGAVERVAEHLASHPRVSGASPVRRYRLLGAPGGDPYVPLQIVASTLQLEQAHRLATGRGVRVALIDTGIDLQHPDLAGRVARVADFVTQPAGKFAADIHGTEVAGVLAATGGNGIGLVGVAPEAELWALRACWPESPGAREAVCDSYSLLQALDFAVTAGAQVINLSLAGPRDALLERVVREAVRRGIVVVAAAEGDPPSFPASVPGVVAVYAWTEARPVAADAPAVPSGALAAPGVDVLTTVPGGGYDFVSGSSFSAAQASGVAALLLERDPKLRPAELAALLAASAVEQRDAPAGAVRLLDAFAAVTGERDRAASHEQH
jgi:subtilisin family serine protease